MREFQRRCLSALGPVLGALETDVRWEHVECAADEDFGHIAGDVYCRARFEHAGHSFDLYVYTDEAGAYVDGQWFIYEWPDFKDEDSRLIKTFVRFIGACLVGTPADQSYDLARGEANA